MITGRYSMIVIPSISLQEGVLAINTWAYQCKFDSWALDSHWSVSSPRVPLDLEQCSDTGTSFLQYCIEVFSIFSFSEERSGTTSPMMKRRKLNQYFRSRKWYVTVNQFTVQLSSCSTCSLRSWLGRPHIRREAMFPPWSWTCYLQPENVQLWTSVFIDKLQLLLMLTKKRAPSSLQ